MTQLPDKDRQMSDIVERLRATTDGATVNPDGPEAAAEIAKLRAEVERLTANSRSVWNAVGDRDEVIERMVKSERAVLDAVPVHYLLDPPDGGDVSLAEGVQRMAATIERLTAALWDCHALANNWPGVPIIGTQFDRIKKTARAALTEATGNNND